MPRNCANSYGNSDLHPAPRLHKVRQLMLKRPFKSLIARIAVLALALSLVVPFVPAALAQSGGLSYTYAENGTGPVANFTAVDADGDAIEWSLSGADAELFAISANGELTFKKSPNYEKPADDGKDNVYEVTVEASGGSTAVMVTVTNVDEMGSVEIDDLQPQAGESMTATVTDPDGGREQTRWQWSKSMDMAEWEDIAGATSSNYTPDDDDIGYYLRATATYLDGVGSERDSAAGDTLFAVEERPVVNAAPAFADDDDDSTNLVMHGRNVKENAKVGSSVGNPVVASDADNDPLLYSLTDGDEDANTAGVTHVNTDIDTDSDGTATPDSMDGDSLLFAIDRKTGQITTKGTHDDNFDRETAANPESYTVTVTATDPSGSMAQVQVVITIDDVDEAPTIALAGDPLTDAQTASIVTEAGEFSVSTDEQVVLNLTPDDDDTSGFTGALPVFDANDPESVAADDKIKWSISGADAGRFEIAKLVNDDGDNAPNTGADSSAALRWAGKGNVAPSFEDKDSADGDNVYEVTVTAFDGSVGKSQDVIIKLQNTEDTGSVSLTQRTPQVGIPVTARLSDEDGGIKDLTWQWYRGVTDETALPTTDCSADLLTNCVIPKATSSTYTPVAADAAGDGHKLTVRAMYFDLVTNTAGTDGADSGDVIVKTTDGAATARPNSNNAPSFGKDDTATRSVAENAAAKTLVGDPVTATDKDAAPRNLLQYVLSGDGSEAFSVSNEGQISTKKKLDYEARSSYTLTLTATDPSGASASIVVVITVTDEDDPATISASSSYSYMENGTGPVANFTAVDADGDAIEWSLSGADAELFAISANGELTFKKSPNYEKPADDGKDNVYEVTVEASGGSTAVMVTVTNVDEMGSVEIDDLQPQAGESMTATVTDPDGGREQTRWQWSKSMDMAEWEDIAGATSSNYTPDDDDIGYYLRATATYLDGVGSERDSAAGDTLFAVEERPVVNAAPAFADDDDDSTNLVMHGRNVKENAKVGSSVGNPVVASDADNDPLLYSLTDGDEDANTAGVTHVNTDIDTDSDGTATPDSMDGDSLLFAIDRKTGQITTKGTHDDNFDRETAANPESYTVTVTATDPSGSMAQVQVVITIDDVDEAPTIALAGDPLTDAQTASIVTEAGEFSVSTDEQVVLNLTPDDDDTSGFTGALPVFDANDPESVAADDKIKWSISGADAGRFEIAKLVNDDGDNAPNTGADSSAALRWAGKGNVAPSFEDKDSADGDNVYEVTVTAFDGSVGKSQDVIIKLQNTEDTGSVSLTQRTPQVGIPVTARLSDEDGGIKDLTWQWYRGVTDETALPTTDCSADLLTNCVIPKATSSTYTPVAADAAGDGHKLTVRAMYFDLVTNTAGTDGADSGDVIVKTTDGAATARPNSNNAPSFGKDDTATRSVAENAAAKTLVGDPVTATDKDAAPRNLLQYVLSGDGSEAFSVSNEGQISTKKKLDYEARSSYTLTLTATDPSGASASIVVVITVTDEDDAAVITPTTENNAPAFSAESVTLSVDENTAGGAAVGDPITATDEDGQDLTYSLDDSSVVEIWPSGQLTVAEGANLDYEGMMSHTVTLTASDGVDTASIMVTINVNNVGLDNAYDTDDNGEISKDEALAAVDDYFLDTIDRDAVNAVLTLYFGDSMDDMADGEEA